MRLKDWRKAQNISLSELGRMIDRTHATVSRLESGKSLPDWSTVRAIYQATDGAVTLHDFISEDGSPLPNKTKAGKPTRRISIPS